ncbi:MAG TPA: hypothetical protein VKY40_08535 [Halanaerobiales bacterium]|nr:hypothetical protein [Halanaerobiales bacterium]
MPLSKREKRLLILAVLIILGVSLYKFALQPGLEHYQGLGEELAEQEHELLKAGLIITDREKYEGMLAETVSGLQLLEKVFYRSEINEVKLRLMEELDKLFEEKGLVVTSKEVFSGNPGEETAEEDLFRISYRVSLVGGTAELVDFLESILKKEKYYQVQELEIKNDGNDRRLTVYMVIETYSVGGREDETEREL